MKILTLLLALAIAALAIAACANGVSLGGGGAGGEGGEGDFGPGPTTTTTTTMSASNDTAASSSVSGTSASGGLCGNSTIDPGETCDPPPSCPTSCNDGNACTTDTLEGSAANCDAACTFTAITTCMPDGCCPAGCNSTNDVDCAGCGDGIAQAGEQCDDGNLVDTDDCLSNCTKAQCGDGFVHLGIEGCDDGNLVSGDGCSASCSIEATGTHGPLHTFVNLSSSFYVTQFGCSNSGGDPAGDALWFCQHFYNAACTVEPVWIEVQNSANPMMHSGTNCNDPDPTGVSVPNTVCIGGPCKIGDYQGPIGGLTNLICDCP